MAPHARQQRNLQVEDLTIETIPDTTSNGQCKPRLDVIGPQIETINEAEVKTGSRKLHRTSKFVRRLLVTLGIIFSGLGFFLTLMTYVESIPYDQGRTSGPVLLSFGSTMFIIGTTWVFCKHRRKQKRKRDEAVRFGFDNLSFKGDLSGETPRKNQTERSVKEWVEYEKDNYENQLSPISLKYNVTESPNKIQQTADFKALYKEENRAICEQHTQINVSYATGLTVAQTNGNSDVDGISHFSFSSADQTISNGVHHSIAEPTNTETQRSKPNIYIVTAECYAYRGDATAEDYIQNGDDSVQNGNMPLDLVNDMHKSHTAESEKYKPLLNGFNSFRTNSKNSTLDFAPVIKSRSLNNLTVLPTIERSIHEHATRSPSKTHEITNHLRND